jgi:hypothetical protein
VKYLARFQLTDEDYMSSHAVVEAPNRASAWKVADQHLKFLHVEDTGVVGEETDEGFVWSDTDDMIHVIQIRGITVAEAKVLAKFLPVVKLREESATEGVTP